MRRGVRQDDERARHRRRDAADRPDRGDGEVVWMPRPLDIAR